MRAATGLDTERTELPRAASTIRLIGRFMGLSALWLAFVRSGRLGDTTERIGTARFTLQSGHCKLQHIVR